MSLIYRTCRIVLTMSVHFALASIFNGLHSRRHDAEVEFYAFDMLVSDGEDLRKLPLSMRKTNGWRGGSTASTWRRSSRAKSDRICSGTPA